jgi:prepilin-type N-terminal cleavage/methylation domain-containing protein
MARRRGFTLIEVLAVSGLMTLLAVLLSAAWSSLGRPMVETTARARVAHEATLAAASLARDFGGSLPGAPGRLGTSTSGQLVGRMQVADSVLRLCYDGPLVADGVADWDDPDTVISYEVQDGNLVRWDESSGATFVVARGVEQMQLTDLGAAVEIKLTIVHRGLSRTYTLVGYDL